MLTGPFDRALVGQPTRPHHHHPLPAHTTADQTGSAADLVHFS